MQQVNWDNLRYVLMVANKGSVAAAARELNVNRATVARRINAFQADLKCRIFDRSDSGYVLTPEAEKIIDAAREVENTLFHMQRQIAGRELRLEGELRVTTTDTFMVSLIAPHLASFHRKHPHILVEIVTTRDILDLDRRDADVAIRPTPAPEPNLVAKAIYEVEFGIYGAPALTMNPSGDHFQQPWIGFDNTLRSTRAGQWLETSVDPDRICMRLDSFLGARVAAENGIGLAVLPCVLGDDSSVLTKLPLPMQELTVPLWLLTHPDLIRSARVNAFVEHFSAAFHARGRECKDKRNGTNRADPLQPA